MEDGGWYLFLHRGLWTLGIYHKHGDRFEVGDRWCTYTKEKGPYSLEEIFDALSCRDRYRRTMEIIKPLTLTEACTHQDLKRKLTIIGDIINRSK